ncbi:MAG: tripartite tricarboxylate transporter permease [Desulfobacterales bacterium]|nr:tripartite tricarboxylate transporter permease [Desulfobacterales bacterium]
MDFLVNIAGLANGFGVVLTPGNLLYAFVGVMIGTAIGVLPGLGPTAAMALLLPATFHIAPVTAVIMLAGIYYGAMYGGSTTSILVNIPGEAASVMTCLDGYQMARQGRAGRGAGHVRLRLVHRRDDRDRRHRRSWRRRWPASR